MKDESGTLFDASVPDLATSTNDKLLTDLGEAPVAENPALAVTGGGSFKLLVSDTCLTSSYIGLYKYVDPEADFYMSPPNTRMPEVLCIVDYHFQCPIQFFHANPRITYPTIQQNSSACSLLPTFIEVAGRKMDATDLVLDCLRMCRKFSVQLSIAHVFCRTSFDPWPTQERKGSLDNLAVF